MVQLIMILGAGLLIWEGAKGFGPTGIKIGVFKANSEPITGPKARVIGAFVIGIGLVLLGFAAYLGIAVGSIMS